MASLCSSYTDLLEVLLNTLCICCSLCPECFSLHSLMAQSFMPSRLLTHPFLNYPSLLTPALTS